MNFFLNKTVEQMAPKTTTNKNSPQIGINNFALLGLIEKKVECIEKLFQNRQKLSKLKERQALFHAFHRARAQHQAHEITQLGEQIDNVEQIEKFTQQFISDLEIKPSSDLEKILLHLKQEVNKHYDEYIGLKTTQSNENRVFQQYHHRNFFICTAFNKRVYSFFRSRERKFCRLIRYFGR